MQTLGRRYRGFRQAVLILNQIIRPSRFDLHLLFTPEETSGLWLRA